MDFDLDFVEEDESLEENEEGEGVNQTHSGEKLKKCNQCNYASSQAGHLRAHLKTHSGEKSNKCNQCDCASSHDFDLPRMKALMLSTVAVSLSGFLGQVLIVVCTGVGAASWIALFLLWLLSNANADHQVFVE